MYRIRGGHKTEIFYNSLKNAQKAMERMYGDAIQKVSETFWIVQLKPTTIVVMEKIFPVD